MSFRRLPNILPYLLLCYLSCFGLYASASIEEAQKAYAERDYKRSFGLLRDLSETGDARAQYNLANMFREGLGTNRNSEEGFRWMRRSASKGFAPAQGALGEMYKNGEGVTQDFKQAILWLRDSQIQGDATAGLALGKIYLEGKVTTKNEDTAKSIFEDTLNKITEKNFDRPATLGLIKVLATLNNITGEQQLKLKPSIERLISSTLAANSDNAGGADTKINTDVSAALERQLIEVRQQKENLHQDLERITAEKNSLALNAEAQNDSRKKLTIEIQKKEELIKELDKLRLENEKLSKPQLTYDQRSVHALVIGNSAYPGSSSLKNPVNDAKLIAERFRALNFNVSVAINSNRTALVKALSDFSKNSANADIGIIYYAGHGIQASGINYILPVDIDVADISQVALQGISLNTVMDQYVPGNTKIAFLDACREHPAARTSVRGFTRGLAPISVSEGTLIAYATKDGGVAYDGEGSANSPFTESLARYLSDPEDIAVVLRKVRDDVLKKTKGQQQPWEYGSLTGGSLVLSRIKPRQN
jgi:TPR repeat protein